jgi:tyramine---L-glutamate ligase
MRVLVCEAVCGGFWPEVAAGSLLREGRAMLAALVNDLLTSPRLTVEVLWDGRLPFAPRTVLERDTSNRVVWCGVDGPEGARDELSARSAACDAVWLIAPETGGLLENLAQQVERVGGRLFSPGATAVKLCGDKLALAEWMEERGISAIATSVHKPGEAVASELFPLVVKPRDGAGSQSTWRLRGAHELAKITDELDPRGAWIRQPWVAGRALSVAGIVTESVGVQWLPVGEQQLSDDDRFAYLGGTIPARDVDATRLLDRLGAALATIPGLRGYIGCDLIERADTGELVVCEINPRLTTSYVGYRALFGHELVESVVTGEARSFGDDELLRRSARFQADGEVKVQLEQVLHDFRSGGA